MEKQRWEESQKRRAEERRSEKRKSQKKEDAGVRKGRTVATHCAFQWFVAPEGRKVGSPKRRVRRLARWEMKNCMPLWREAHFEVKMYKTHQVRSTFRSWDVEKVHAVRGAKHISKSKCFKTHHVQSTFGRLRCWKSVPGRGAKHISKSKCFKHRMLGPLLKVQMLFCVAGARVCSTLSQNDGRRGTFAEMHFAWQAQYKRHVHQRC